MIKRVLSVVTAINAYSPEYGPKNCYGYFKLLKVIFPEAEGYYNSNHVLAKIDGKFYDKRGLANPEGFLSIEEHFGYENLEKQFKTVG